MRFKPFTGDVSPHYPYGFTIDVAADPDPSSLVRGTRRVTEVHAWCSDQFGTDEPGQTRWASTPSWGSYFFRDQSDATAFRIRWG